MKRGVSFALDILLVTILVVLFNMGLNKLDSYSVRKGWVESVEGNLVTIIDTSGTAWEWCLDEGQVLNKWDKVKMKMDNNHTTTTEKDDIILKLSVDK